MLRILNEPTAAALAYGFGKGLDQRVAVYDLGGGTFDISILEIGKDIFEVLSTCGDTFLGGDDFDDRIIDLLADEFVQREGINLRNDPYAFEKLKVAAEAAKNGLSLDEEVEIRIPDILAGADGEPRSIERRVTSMEFSRLVIDLIQRTFKVCDEAMQQADVTVKDLDGVILVGGPTRLPVIRQAVRDYFQQEPRADVDPDEVVAMGAAIHANSLVNESAESFLLDVTPLDLRIGVAGGMAEPVIERNTPVPIEQSRMFTTFPDYQETVDIRVYQGDSREASENELLGQFEFSGFKKARRGEVEIEVTFEINADGIVSVKACDPETGAQTQMSITLSSGLSSEELETILEENPAARVKTAAPVTSVAPSPGMPAPDAELSTLEDDDVEHATAGRASLKTSRDELDDGDLEVLAGTDDTEADFLDEGDLDEELDVGLADGDLEALAVLDEGGGEAPIAGTSDDLASLDEALDGRALPAIEEDVDLELASDPAPSGAAGQVGTFAPAGEAIVDLGAGDDAPLLGDDDGVPLELAGAGDAVVGSVELETMDASELELIDEAVVELQPEPTTTKPNPGGAPEELFDRDNRDLSAGLDDES